MFIQCTYMYMGMYVNVYVCVCVYLCVSVISSFLFFFVLLHTLFLFFSISHSLIVSSYTYIGSSFLIKTLIYI